MGRRYGKLCIKHSAKRVSKNCRVLQNVHREEGMKFIIEHLSKNYEKKQVLKDIDFTFEEGKIYGLLGRNGA